MKVMTKDLIILIPTKERMDKIKTILNFQPNHSIEDAISELCSAFKNNLLPNSFDNDNYFNVKKLQNLRVK